MNKRCIGNYLITVKLCSTWTVYHPIDNCHDVVLPAQQESLRRKSDLFSGVSTG